MKLMLILMVTITVTMKRPWSQIAPRGVDWGAAEPYREFAHVGHAPYEEQEQKYSIREKENVQKPMSHNHSTKSDCTIAHFESPKHLHNSKPGKPRWDSQHAELLKYHMCTCAAHAMWLCTCDAWNPRCLKPPSSITVHMWWGRVWLSVFQHMSAKDTYHLCTISAC